MACVGAAPVIAVGNGGGKTGVSGRPGRVSVAPGDGVTAIERGGVAGSGADGPDASDADAEGAGEDAVGAIGRSKPSRPENQRPAEKAAMVATATAAPVRSKPLVG